MKHDRIADQPLIEFDAVPRRETVGGWTPGRQRAFITALAATGSVARAAAAVKMSKTGVYALRAAEGGEDFVRAWNIAVEDGVAAIKSVAFERAVDGIEEDVWYRGEKRGTRTRYDNRLLAALLRLYAVPPRPPRGPVPPPAPPIRPREDLVAALKSMARRIAREEREAEAEARAHAEPLLPFAACELDEVEPDDDPHYDLSDGIIRRPPTRLRLL